MKQYEVITDKLNIRDRPSASDDESYIGELNKGATFYANDELIEGIAPTGARTNLFTQDTLNRFVSKEWIKEIASGSVIKINTLDPGQSIIDYKLLLEIPDATLQDFDGSNINIGVLDTGINAAHVDLTNKIDIARCFDFTKAPPDFTDKSELGHGTQIAGLVAGNTTGDNGIKGIAANAAVSIYKVLFDDETSKGSILQNALTQLKNANQDILNMSFDITVTDYNANLTLLDSVSSLSICVAAAGNNADLLNAHGGINVPAFHPNIISVGSVDRNFFEANPAPQFHPRVDFLVPDFDFPSCFNTSSTSYSTIRDCSAATAIVTGIIALLLSQTNALKRDVSGVREALRALAQPYSQNLFSSFCIIKPQ